jgi:hypothetical protein
LLVGDIVQAFREAATDQPQTLGIPLLFSLTPVNDANGTIPLGNYVIQITALTSWGETLPSVELPVTVGAGQNAIQIVYSSSTSGNPTALRVYLGSASGAENLWIQITPAPATPFRLLAVPVLSGAPPSRNSAYLPDTDGDAVNAFTMFRWVCDALKIASQVCGGLLDYCGISSISGVPQYIAPGQWKKISSFWYDGYPLAMDDAGNYFRRNSITASVLASVAVSMFTDRMMLEVWPQPSRTAAATTLAAPLALTDTQATLTSSAGFLLTNGFAQLGTEIVSYSQILGNVLQNLVRGLGGTVQSSQASGSAVSELNMFWQGWRKYNAVYVPGQSNVVIPVPLGWETILPMYALARMKLAEQNTQEYTALKKEFEEELKSWFKSNNVVAGPRQIGDQTGGLEVFPSFGGGWVIP